MDGQAEVIHGESETGYCFVELLHTKVSPYPPSVQCGVCKVRVSVISSEEDSE